MKVGDFVKLKISSKTLGKIKKIDGDKVVVVMKSLSIPHGYFEREEIEVSKNALRVMRA